jgi:hypothetical protein
VLLNAMLTWAQQCLIIVSRGVSRAWTSWRASASSWRLTVSSVAENELPSVWMDSIVDGILLGSFGEIATSRLGCSCERCLVFFVSPLLVPLVPFPLA